MANAAGFNNGDIFLYALYRRGGAGKYVDVEDVFAEMWELAPSRFRWRRHGYPNYKILAKSIVDISQRGDGELLLGEGYARQLSAEGVQWVKARLKRFERLGADVGAGVSQRRPSQRVVVGLEKSPLVVAFLDGREIDLGRNDVALLLRCAPDAPRSVWQERLATLRSAATDAGRPDLLRFLDHLPQARPEWFGGNG